MYFFALIFSLLAACTPTNQSSQQQVEAVPSPSLHEIIIDRGLEEKPVNFYINKAAYYLEVRYDTMTLKRYPVVFGKDPVNDKLQEGDRRTPEGSFKVRAHYDHAKWRYFIWLDYPNETSWAKHKAAKAAGQITQDASIGGEIGIHGVPEDYDYAIDERMNWTLGCISLRNADLEELIPLLEVGMQITIE